MKMVATLLLSIQSMAPLSLTVTFLLDLSTVFGKLRISKAKLEDPSWGLLWLFMELEPLFAYLTLKITRSKS